MAGVGKSFIGKKLAQKCNFDFIDVDKTMENETGLNTTDLLEKVGDEEFLRIEEKVYLRDLERAKTGTVFAPGGSIVYCKSFIENLDKVLVIYLEGNFQEILKRIKKDPRGIVYSGKYSLEEIYKQREMLYKKYANIALDATGDADKIVDKLYDIIFKEKNNLC